MRPYDTEKYLIAYKNIPTRTSLQTVCYVQYKVTETEFSICTKTACKIVNKKKFFFLLQ